MIYVIDEVNSSTVLFHYIFAPGSFPGTFLIFVPNQSRGIETEQVWTNQSQYVKYKIVEENCRQLDKILINVSVFYKYILNLLKNPAHVGRAQTSGSQRKAGLFEIFLPALATAK
jgi:hypothetical protein